MECDVDTHAGTVMLGIPCEEQIQIEERYGEKTEDGFDHK